jgi:membrane protease YdiL (CAAX protease family)
MSSLAQPIRTYPLLSFTLFACLFGWVFFIAKGFGANVEPLAMPLAPLLAAVIVAAAGGRAELRTYWRQLKRFRTSPWWYVLALVAPVAIIVAVVLLNSALGAPRPTSSQLGEWTGLPVTFVFFLILIGVGEEAGWTAFAAPRLLNRHTFLVAWLVLAAIRFAWHLPLMISGDLPWSVGLVAQSAFQFIVLWMYLRTRGVWFLAALWHAMLNTVGSEYFFPMVDGDDKARLWLLMNAAYALVAIAVFVVDRHRLAPASRLRHHPQPA